MSLAPAVSVSVAVALLCCTPCPAQEGWSRFRGPDGSGVVESATALPMEFGSDQKVVWKTELPFARSSPVLTEDVVFLTAQEDERLITFCLERDSGEVRWEETLERARDGDLYDGNDSASSTPVTDGTNVYCFFDEFGLISYDDEGLERWRLPLGPFRSFYGVSASPVLAGTVLVMVCDQVGPSFIVGVDKDTGDLLWREERLVQAESWATPLVRELEGGGHEVLVFGTFLLRSYDAPTGAVRWTREGYAYNPISSPVLSGNRLILTATGSSGTPTPFSSLLGADADGDGRLTEAEIAGTDMDGHFGWIDPDGDGFAEKEEWDAIQKGARTRDYGILALDLDHQEGPASGAAEAWRFKKSIAYINSPLVLDGVVYMVTSGGILTLLDVESGEVLSRERIRGSQGNIFPSPVAADGKVYVATNAGTVSVLKAGRTHEVLAVNDLGEEIRATPAIADGFLYLRTATALYCFGEIDGL